MIRMPSLWIKLTKMVYFTPIITQITIEGTARLLFDHTYKLHGLPNVIPSDRDASFTSRFWGALHGILGTKLVMSIAFHPKIMVCFMYIDEFMARVL
jgi:hypothetical protein